MSIADLLREIRMQRLRLFVVGSRIACGPADVLTNRIRAGLRTHKDTLLPILAAWGPEAGLDVLHLLFEVEPQAEPFRLDVARWVCDPGRFYASLYEAVQAGPNGPRARTGALHADLRLIHRMHVTELEGDMNEPAEHTGLEASFTG